ncbi:hypothetical protein ABPG72_016578 [Tetrahymena utriculariae]
MIYNYVCFFLAKSINFTYQLGQKCNIQRIQLTLDILFEKVGFFLFFKQGLAKDSKLLKLIRFLQLLFLQTFSVQVKSQLALLVWLINTFSVLSDTGLLHKLQIDAVLLLLLRFKLKSDMENLVIIIQQIQFNQSKFSKSRAKGFKQMDVADKRRVNRMTFVSLLINISNALSIYFAALSYSTQSQFFFNLEMVVMLIDKILSVVIVIIKYSYLQTWILDALNLSFLIKYSQLYFPEHQSMLTYAIYIKVIPALVIQLVYMYLQGSVFCGIDGNQAWLFLIYLQLNIFNLFITVKTLFLNSDEFQQIQNGNAEFSNRKIFLENSKDIFNTFCLYNMWAVILTHQKSNYLYQNVSLWCVIIFFLSMIIEFNKTKQFKSTVYALCSFEISFKNLKSMQYYEIFIKKFHTFRLHSILIIFFLISICNILLQKKQDFVFNLKESTQAYYLLMYILVLFNFMISFKKIILIHKLIRINISHKNKNITQAADIILQDTKSSHFIILSNLSIFYDYFEIDSSILFQEDNEKDRINEVEKFYFFSMIFEILIKRNGSVLIQSFLKTQNGNQVTLINKNFKFNEQLQLSLLSSSQYLPDLSLFNIQFNKENCNKIIQERYSKGILFGNTFYQALREKQQQMHEASAKVLKSSMFQVNAFQKQLKCLVINNPSQVLFDLYDN